MQQPINALFRRLPAGIMTGMALTLGNIAFAQRGSAPRQPNGQNQRPQMVSPQFGPLGGTRSPIAPFERPLNNGGANPRNLNDNEVNHYTSPLSPFATYRAPYNPYFSRYTQSNFRYSNGLFGNGTFYYNWGESYFPGGASYYPYYVPNFAFGLTYYSPYSLYYQVTPAFIAADFVYQAPPQIIYVPVPVYVNGAYQGSRREDIDDYYLNRAPRDENPAPKKDTEKKDGESGIAEKPQETERPIDTAAAEIAKAWRTRDIQLLARYIDDKTKVAVYLRGRYQYSLDTRDYLDVTRDAFQATKTVKFEFDAPARKERGVYLLTGRHVYQAKDGTEHTVHVSYVLELKDDKYLITQVGSAPDEVREDR